MNYWEPPNSNFQIPNKSQVAKLKMIQPPDNPPRRASYEWRGQSMEQVLLIPEVRVIRGLFRFAWRIRAVLGISKETRLQDDGPVRRTGFQQCQQRSSTQTHHRQARNPLQAIRCRVRTAGMICRRTRSIVTNAIGNVAYLWTLRKAKPAMLWQFCSVSFRAWDTFTRDTFSAVSSGWLARYRWGFLFCLLHSPRPDGVLVCFSFTSAQ